MPAPSDADARAVLRSFRMADNSLSRLGNAGGFSGAALWRVRGTVHDFCLKALAPGADVRRCRDTAVLLDWTCRRHALDYVPRLLTPPQGMAAPVFPVEHAGRVWEMAEG